MKIFYDIKNKQHDASGIEDPDLYYWAESAVGTYYPAQKLDMDDFHSEVIDFIEEEELPELSLDEIALDKFNEENRAKRDWFIDLFGKIGDEPEEDHSMLKRQYDALEELTLDALRKKVKNSKATSRHMQTPAVKTTLFDYDELVIVHDELTWLDGNGQHYSLYADCSLEDLIDFLQKQV